MNSSNPASLDWLLDDLVERLSGVRDAVVLSADGLLLGRSNGMERDDAERFGAMASAFNSLARSAGGHFGAGDARQIVVELDGAVLFVISAGYNACLAVLASESASMGMVAFEMNRTVQRAKTHLSAIPRRSLTGQIGS